MLRCRLADRQVGRCLWRSRSRLIASATPFHHVECGLELSVERWTGMCGHLYTPVLDHST